MDGKKSLGSRKKGGGVRVWGRFVEGSEWVEGRDCAGGGTGRLGMG